MVEYPFARQLRENASIHCATLVVTENLVLGSGMPRLAGPNAALRNGTITFVRSEGRTFSITCHHVVQHYRDVLAARGKPYSHSMRTMLNGFYGVQDHFVQPQVQFGDTPPDIAIREINPAHVVHIGKVAMDLDAMKEPPETVRHAYAVGFPETLKYHRDEPGRAGYRVSMPQIEILAELQGRPDRRFTMFSELQNAAPDIDYSGMSGGPIFWETESDYGLLGIIYEGGPGGDRNGMIFVYGEIATPSIVKGWIAQCPQIR